MPLFQYVSQQLLPLLLLDLELLLLSELFKVLWLVL